jgi:prepilin-type N-terminal cleavage/methylation domain
MKHKRHKSGFTIIEVVLVLAIAGLIFAMVFIALPALNQSQRNTQRKRDAAQLVTAMQQWFTHNSSSVTDSFSSRNSKQNGFCTFYKRYVGDELKDPSTGEPYKVALWGSTNVVNCMNGDTINRGSYDPDVHGSAGMGDSDNWANMEVGDIQYDDGAYCEDEGFNDDIGGERYSGAKIFAFRIKLEGGAALCVDNGYDFSK